MLKKPVFFSFHILIFDPFLKKGEKGKKGSDRDVIFHLNIFPCILKKHIYIEKNIQNEINNR